MTELRVSVYAWVGTEESQMSAQKMKQESEFLFTQRMESTNMQTFKVASE